MGKRKKLSDRDKEEIAEGLCSVCAIPIIIIIGITIISLLM